MAMTYLSRSSLLAALVSLAAGTARAQTVADSGTFVVRHSGDTVATETFFEQSAQMEQAHPHLYGELRRFYGLDPARWS